MRSERALRHVTAPQPRDAVVACGLARHHRAYVLDGLGHRADCRFIDTFDELDRLLAASPRCDALILVPRDHRGRDALATIGRVAREWPDTALVVLYPARPEAAPSIRALTLAGVHQFVFEGVGDTAATLAQAVDNGRRECAAESVFARLQPLIPAPLHSIVQVVVARPDTLNSVEDVAAALGVHRKTLVNRCARNGYLQPGAIIVWCRLAMVAHMLERTGATVESIALTLGFASHTALRNLIKRYTGRTATEIRREGGLLVVLSSLSTATTPTSRARLPIA